MKKFAGKGRGCNPHELYNINISTMNPSSILERQTRTTPDTSLTIKLHMGGNHFYWGCDPGKWHNFVVFVLRK